MLPIAGFGFGENGRDLGIQDPRIRVRVRVSTL